jgi:hypothetical protein
MIYSEQAYKDALKAFIFEFPGFEMALANIGLKLSKLRIEMISGSLITMAHGFVDEGYIWMIENPEHSAQIISSQHTFKL